MTTSITQTAEQGIEFAARQPLYPHTFGGFPPCRGCLQRRPDLARTADPRWPGRLIDLCSSCAASPTPLADLVTPGMRAGQWERLAHWSINGELDDEHVARALAELAPHLDEQAGQQAFEVLVGALLFRQQVTDGDVTTCEVEPCLADPDVLAEAAQVAVEDALAELTAGAR